MFFSYLAIKVQLFLCFYLYAKNASWKINKRRKETEHKMYNHISPYDCSSNRLYFNATILLFIMIMSRISIIKSYVVIDIK